MASSSPPLAHDANQAFRDAILTFVNGFTNENVKQFTASVQLINGTDLLHGIDPVTASEEAIGRKLHRAILHLGAELGTLFTMTVQHCIHLQSHRLQVESLRTEIVRQLLEAERDAAVNPIPLDPAAESAMMDVALYDFKKDQRNTRSGKLEVDPVLLEDFRIGLQRNLLDRRQQFMRELQAQQQAQTQLPQLRAAREAHTHMVGVIDALISFHRSIIHRLRESLDSSSNTAFAAIRMKLRGRVTLPSGTEVHDPMMDSHLSGILTILYDHYVVDSLQVFFDALGELFAFQMTQQESTNSPDVALARLVHVNNDWIQRGLFSRLSQDLLFTCIAVKSVHPSSPFRTHVIRQTTDFMRRVQSGEVTPTGTSPIFDYFQTCTKQFVQDERLRLSAAANATPPPPTGGSRTPFKPYNRVSFTNPAPPPGLEVAAAVTTTSSTPPYRPPGNDASKRTFDTEVLLSAQWVHNSQPYVAVRQLASICATCFPLTGGGSPCPRRSNHFISRCSRCRFYGHKKDNCLQTVSADGAPIPK
jgi:hypothetical protein